MTYQEWYEYFKEYTQRVYSWIIYKKEYKKITTGETWLEYDKENKDRPKEQSKQWKQDNN